MKVVKDDHRPILLELAELLGGICELCLKPELKKRNGKYEKGGSFTIHHRRYRRNKQGVIIEKIHSDFKKLNSKGKLVPDQLSYYKYLKPLVYRNKRRFRVLHNKCHYAIETTARWSPETRKRLFRFSTEIYNNNHAYPKTSGSVARLSIPNTGVRHS